MGNKIALVVGIDHYENSQSLYGCCNDALAIKDVLEKNEDGKKNFEVGLRLAKTGTYPNRIRRSSLMNLVQKLFKEPAEIALFYFSGHGYVTNTGGYLLSSECKHGDDGLSMSELLGLANASPAQNKVIILDCCHSGYMGKTIHTHHHSLLTEGMTILTASGEDQYAAEVNNSGVFTNLLVDALRGSAANLTGQITPGSVYAHIDQSLGWLQQRPIFKTNISRFVTLREVTPPIHIEELRKITELFTSKTEDFKLGPEYEPTYEFAEQDKVEKFAILQKYNRLNLVVPFPEEHMYFAAMNRKYCRLTLLGQHYWELVKRNKI